MKYRMPSINTLLGVTKAKRRLKKDMGIYEATKYTNAPKNFKRKIKRKARYESEIIKLFRFIARMLK